MVDKRGNIDISGNVANGRSAWKDEADYMDKVLKFGQEHPKGTLPKGKVTKIELNDALLIGANLKCFVYFDAKNIEWEGTLGISNNTFIALSPRGVKLVGWIAARLAWFFRNKAESDRPLLHVRFEPAADSGKQ